MLYYRQLMNPISEKEIWEVRAVVIPRSYVNETAHQVAIGHGMSRLQIQGDVEEFVAEYIRVFEHVQNEFEMQAEIGEDK